jgi:hypothetical protein
MWNFSHQQCMGLKMLISQGLKRFLIASVAVNLVEFSYKKKLVRLSAAPSRR